MSRFAPRLALVAVVAAAVRVLFTTLVDPRVGELSDASAYHLLGAHLADGLGYIRPFDFTLLGEARATAEYPPLYPGLLGVVSWLGVRSVDAQQLLVGTALGTTTVVLVGLVGRRVGGPRVGLVAATIAAVYPMLFQNDAILMAEGLYAAIVSGALLLAYRALDAPSVGRFTALGVVVGAAGLTRGEGLLLAPILLLPLAALLPGRAWPERLRLAGVALLAAALVVAPWTLRNLARFDGVVIVSNNLGTVLDGANCDVTYYGDQIGLWRAELGGAAGTDFGCFQGFDISDPDFDEAAAARRHRREGLDYVADHTRRLPAVMVVRVLRTFALYPDWSAQIDVESLEGRTVGWQWAGTLMFWVLAALAVVGGVRMRRRVVLWPLLAPVVLVVLTSALTYGNQRFRVAAEPSIVVLAAAGLVGLLRPAGTMAAPPSADRPTVLAETP